MVSGDLIVEFNRNGEEPDRHLVQTPEAAMLAALRLLAKRSSLLPGDTLTVRLDTQLPEHSRASHFS
jgi:hypothetical protein